MPRLDKQAFKASRGESGGGNRGSRRFVAHTLAGLPTDLPDMKQLGQVCVFGSVRDSLRFCRPPASPDERQQEQTQIAVHPYEGPVHPCGVPACR